MTNDFWHLWPVRILTLLPSEELAKAGKSLKGRQGRASLEKDWMSRARENPLPPPVHMLCKMPCQIPSLTMRQRRSDAPWRGQDQGGEPAGIVACEPNEEGGGRSARTAPRPT